MRHAFRHIIGAAAVTTLALVWLPDMIQHERRSNTLAQALLQATTPPLLTDGIHVKHGAALPLPSGQANVRIYLIAPSSNDH